MKLTINQKEQVIDQDALSVVDLLKAMEVKTPDMVSVQLNGTILRRSMFESTIVKENDKVNFLYFMGGGSGNRL